MRRSLPLAMLLVGSFAASVRAQVSLDESLSRAALVHDRTTLSLALNNTLQKPSEAMVQLQWLDPMDRITDSVSQPFHLEAGKSVITFPFPLPVTKADSRLLRLRYSIVPRTQNLSDFASSAGILSFVHTAPYAFSLQILGVPQAQTTPNGSGLNADLYVLAAHPVSRQPIANVQVEAHGSKSTTDKEGLAILHVALPKDYDGDDIPVSARLGDFVQTMDVPGLNKPPGKIRIEFDKPLYQPGQILHVRTLALASDGRPRSGDKEKVRVLDPDGNLVHTAALTSSRYGIARIDWTIPSNAKSGKYEVEVSSDNFDEPFEREIEIRAYELPSFRVSARSTRSYYFTGETALIAINATYLFGKPVPHARVRIETAISDKPVWSGELNATGSGQAVLPFAGLTVPKRENFMDRHYTAFVTDPSTNRTEQRQFDVRLSRTRLHLYVAGREATLQGEHIYLSVYSPDGMPARATVSASTGPRCATNRFGLCKIDIPASADRVTFTAAAGASRSQSLEVRLYPPASLVLETDHALYRQGESVHCRLAARIPSTPVLLLAWNADHQVVFSQRVKLASGRADLDIPYDARFGERLSLVAVAADAFADTEILFPGSTPLQVSIYPSKATYRPGETAHIDFLASSQAALGISIVDQAVFERAEQDSNLPRAGGMSQEDLRHLSPSKIDDDFQLLARVLAAVPQPLITKDDWLDTGRSYFQTRAGEMLAPVKRQLDSEYQRVLDYPHNEHEFSSMASAMANLRDAWGQRFYPSFRVDGSQDVLCINSSGPDKQSRTDDDFCALQIDRPWFGLYEPLIRKALAATPDFPATQNEWNRQLQTAGILFPALRDPWRLPLRAEISYQGPTRAIGIQSAGPDGIWNTDDDIPIANFQGTYFSQTDRTMRKILTAAKEFPRSTKQALEDLHAAGFHFETLRDPWRHALTLRFHIEDQFADHIRRYTYAQYRQPPELRQELAPIKAHLAVLDVRSNGPDGIPGTYDDFTLATFARWLKTDAVPPSLASSTRPIEVPGQATLTGVVKDRSGAVITNASVSLDKTHETHTDSNGIYTFAGVPPRLYEIRIQSFGFQVYVLADVPAAPDQVTKADVVLELGSVSESVEVVGPPPPAQESASANMRSATATPRLREYFPETLYWQPELVTDANGKAAIDVKLADSITTWKIALVSSNLNGDIEENTADLLAFQPFAVDLDVPRSLTQGDRINLSVPIRNYSDRAQRPRIDIDASGGIDHTAPLQQIGAISPGTFANILLPLRASAAAPAAKLRVTATGNSASDAIEKTIAIHPDGERFERAAADLIRQSGTLDLALPRQVAPDSLRGEVRIYPSIMSRMVEAMSVMLQRPWGCGEQTISSTYPNLLLLRGFREAGLQDQPIQAKAKHNLQLGYDRLLGYQAASGGFTYWGKDDVDIALTAYAIEFLQDARDFVTVDDARIEMARTWLATQKPDAAELKAWQLRGLMGGTTNAFDLNKRLAELARAAKRFRDPYAIAQFALAALEANQPELAHDSIRSLVSTAQPANGATFWDLSVNTPFHGWGHAGQVETTAIVVRALARWCQQDPRDKAGAEALRRGALYLLRNTTAGGAWATSQSTAQALLALLEVWRPAPSTEAVQFTIQVGGTPARKVSLAAADSDEPLTIDVSPFLKAGRHNLVTVTSSRTDRPFEAQFDAAWYQPWQGVRPASDLDFQASFDRLQASANEAITCHVKVARPAFRGFGMLIVRVGLPPASEVDRGTLTAAVANSKGVDSFEVAPDAVTFYVWPRAADTTFSFVFRPRFAMVAKSTGSIAYDYYNPDDRTVLPPQLFTIR